jgi:cytoskeletal protein CcmA (bactofilin family)
MVIEGRVQGKITVPSGTLTIAKGAKVEGEIKVRALVLHGELKGTVKAGERTVISETAEMTGDVITPKITIANGARFSGGIRMKE